MAFVYCITNLKTSTKYIGKTTDPERRWRGHKNASISGQRGRLYHAMRKFGLDLFTFQIVKEFTTETEAFSYEERLIQELKQAKVPLYNIAPGGMGGFAGTEESRKRLRQYWSDNARRAEMREKVNESYKQQHVRARVAKKLSEAQVLEIRKRFQDQDPSDFNEVGAEYGVSGGSIWQILRFKTWKFAGT